MSVSDSNKTKSGMFQAPELAYIYKGTFYANLLFFNL